MAKERKLRFASKLEKPPSIPTQLRARQIMTFQHPEGGEGLMMVDIEGMIYIRSDAGWKAFDMTEET